MNRVESNILIAVFMGHKHYPPNDFKYKGEHGTAFWTGETMQYDTSWDWLMPVVERIENMCVDYSCIQLQNNNLGESPFTQGYLTEFSIYSQPIWEGLYPYKTKGLHKGETRLESTYGAVVEFIKWFSNNEWKRTNNSESDGQYRKG